jgi:hypothetical protein
MSIEKETTTLPQFRFWMKILNCEEYSTMEAECLRDGDEKRGDCYEIVRIDEGKRAGSHKSFATWARKTRRTDGPTLLQ